jgi:hypothetical protein
MGDMVEDAPTIRTYFGRIDAGITYLTRTKVTLRHDLGKRLQALLAVVFSYFRCTYDTYPSLFKETIID